MTQRSYAYVAICSCLAAIILTACGGAATTESGSGTPSNLSDVLLVITGLGAIVAFIASYKYLIIWIRNTLGKPDENNPADSVDPRSSPKKKKTSPRASKPARKNQPAGNVFISYRRSDSADIAGRIYDRLTGKFGRNPIFKDVDSIPLGLDFKEYLDAKVSECSVLLAIIGDRWLETNGATGKKRLDDPADFVRIEIESALERGIPVIPLLVRGAQMPSEKNLPGSLKKLVYRNGIPIRSDPDFHRDMDRLITALEKIINLDK